MSFPELANRIIHWMKTNKFWASVIALLIITIVVRVLNPFTFGYAIFFNFALYYTLFGGLIWSGYTGKKGMSMISLGIFFALLSLSSLWTILSHLKFDAVGFSIVSTWTLLSVSLLFFGIKRYRHWLRNQEAF